ncbi:hypothetical protein B0A50_08647 [Salinomyces thailandicus]|uniref:Uncharacterized protein n=1 Tax=Salinomyces thailandicus TaxID=706561 RepID=A0A4U0TJF3_9PEZI|nr:hypothetical protein B0A50_08647 [Salinomyces thailandica]
MNKFLNRKKSPEDVTVKSDASSARSPPLPLSPGLKKSATSRWKKTKKLPEPEPESEPELNIAAALPSSDDFRTSLLMPNLSARFSMLREQDPNSLIGKASDDSVLQPKRRSRMLDYGFGNGVSPLNDIAEVQSIKSSIRPPFAYEKHLSCGSEDGYGSENDSTHQSSVLLRSRHGEGNSLFGGRQKVYKIAKGGASSTKLGKAVYEDDVGMSAFQRYRKERGTQDGSAVDHEDPEFDFGLEQSQPGDQEDGAHEPTSSDSAKDLSHSPSLSSFDKKRSTTSSMARSEARSSTAATSIASQPPTSTPSPLTATSQTVAPAPPPTVAPAPPPSAPNLRRADTKTRRLYEQGLDQHMHDQQTSALTRLNSFQRQRSLHHGNMQSPPTLQTAKSTGSLHEKDSQPVYALRGASPTRGMALAPLVTYGSLGKVGSNIASPATSVPQSPVSPQAIDFDATPLTQALEPGDRGKATATGAFNKPAQQFDERQYLERQQQLQRSQSRGASRNKEAVQQRIGQFEQKEGERTTPDASARGRSLSAPRGIPKRGDSLRTKPEPSKAYNPLHKAANKPPPPPVPPAPPAESAAGAQQYDTHRTFFGNISASDSEDEDDEQQRRDPISTRSDFSHGPSAGRWQPTPLPSVSEHPAMRNRDSKPSLAEEDEDEDAELAPQPLRPTQSSLSVRGDTQEAEPTEPVAIDSPTLGPSSTEPLSGMVHHLRQKSNQSSLYPTSDAADDVPELPGMLPQVRPADHDQVGFRSTIGSGSDSRLESSQTNSNPWDLDEIDNSYFLGEEDRSPISPVEGNVFQPQAFPRAPSQAATSADRQSEASQYAESANAPTWQHELRKQHTRDASTATQQERDAFANELAARRAAIQENMKSMVERDTSTRNDSPAPSAGGAHKTFSMLRSKPSRESVAPYKAMKMLGLGGNASSLTLGSQYERSGQSFDASRPRNNSGARLPPLSMSQNPSMQSNERERTRPSVDSETSSAARQLPMGRSSQASRDRSRSNSEATAGRSRSRTGPYRDDLERAMVEGMGSSAAAHADMAQREVTPKASPEGMHSSIESLQRARSNSRTPATSSYFDAKGFQPLSTPASRLAAGGMYSPAGSSARPSPTGSPIVQNPTPPLSGPNTPQGASFKDHALPILQPRSVPLRKKTISKSDISEPTLVSSTSNVDTIDLPDGASLKNGIDAAPPLPPLNPKRRGTRKLFGLGRSEVSDDASNPGNYGRSKTPDPWMSRATAESDLSASRGVRRPSDGRFAPQGFENSSTPALQQYGLPSGPASPERVQRSLLPQNGPMDGGMF